MRNLVLGGWLLLLAACGDDEPKFSNEGFGSECTVVTDSGSTECSSGVCSDAFDQLGHPVCSQKCSDASTCPAGSEGQKCNGKGYCKP